MYGTQSAGIQYPFFLVWLVSVVCVFYRAFGAQPQGRGVDARSLALGIKQAYSVRMALRAQCRHWHPEKVKVNGAKKHIDA
jgi:hypothetical protein